MDNVSMGRGSVILISIFRQLDHLHCDAVRHHELDSFLVHPLCQNDPRTQIAKAIVFLDRSREDDHPSRDDSLR